MFYLYGVDEEWRLLHREPTEDELSAAINGEATLLRLENDPGVVELRSASTEYEEGWEEVGRAF